LSGGIEGDIGNEIYNIDLVMASELKEDMDDNTSSV
jgi:hypothetical protein